MTACPPLAQRLAIPHPERPRERTPEERRKGAFGPPHCPMCAGSGQRSSAILAGTITCPWCGGRGHVRLERARALRAHLRTKAEREQEQAA